jgi:hypothetical protein
VGCWVHFVSSACRRMPNRRCREWRRQEHKADGLRGDGETLAGHSVWEVISEVRASGQVSQVRLEMIALLVCDDILSTHTTCRPVMQPI